jgi:hypothetical protein
MLAAIGFKDQARFLTHEIDNKRTDWLLAPKLRARELSRSKDRPELSLGIGRIATQ